MTAHDLAQLCTSRRVDFVGIGDSNQVYDGTGWDHGFQYALSQIAPMYATGVVTQNENNGNGSGVGFKYKRQSANGATLGTTSGAPSALADLFSPPFPAKYAYLDDTQQFSSASQQGLGIDTDCPLDVNGNLRFHYGYGTFDVGTGSFRPSIRRDTPPYTPVWSASDVNPVTGSFTHQIGSFDLAAGTRNYPLSFRYCRPSGDPITGPFFGTYCRVENLGHTTGFSYHTLLYRGGQPLRTFVSDLVATPDATLTVLFGEYRRLQIAAGYSPIVVFCINGGLNDKNDVNASVGPIACTSRARCGYMDNLTAIMSRIRGIWELNGWDTDEIRWLLFPSHRVSDNPGDSTQAYLDLYRLAVKDIAAMTPNVTVADLGALTSAGEAESMGWFKSATDRAHLKTIGYEGHAVRIFS